MYQQLIIFLCLFGLISAGDPLIEYCHPYADDPQVEASTDFHIKIKLLTALSASATFTISGITSSFVSGASYTLTIVNSDGTTASGTTPTISSDSTTLTASLDSGFEVGIISMVGVTVPDDFETDMEFTCAIDISGTTDSLIIKWRPVETVKRLFSHGGAFPSMPGKEAAYRTMFWTNRGGPDATDVFEFFFPVEFQIQTTATCHAFPLQEKKEEQQVEVELMLCTMELDELTGKMVANIHYNSQLTVTDYATFYPYQKFQLMVKGGLNPEIEGQYTIEGIWRQNVQDSDPYAKIKFPINIKPMKINEASFTQITDIASGATSTYTIQVKVNEEIKEDHVFLFVFNDYTLQSAGSTPGTTCKALDSSSNEIGECMIDDEENGIVVQGIDGVEDFAVEVSDIVNPSGIKYIITICWSAVDNEENIIKFDLRVLQASSVISDISLTLSEDEVGKESTYTIGFKSSTDVLASDILLLPILKDYMVEATADITAITINSESSSFYNLEEDEEDVNLMNLSVIFPSEIAAGTTITIVITGLTNPETPLPLITKQLTSSDDEDIKKHHYHFWCFIIHSGEENPYGFFELVPEFTCPSSYFIDQKERVCSKCEPTCAECESKLKCTSCVSSALMFKEMCFEACPDGTTTDSENSLCEECPIGCKQCDTETCDACFKGYTLDSTSKACLLCPDQCSECSSTSTCTTCQAGFYVDEDSKCSKCESPCVECSLSESTLVCDSCVSKYLYDSTGSTVEESCVTECGSGFFASKGACLACDDISVVSTTIDNNFEKLVVTFSIEIQPVSTSIITNMCEHIISEAGMAKLGASKCLIVKKQLFIFLPFNDFSFAASDSIGINDGSISSKGCSNIASSLSITIPAFPTDSVSGSLQGPPKVLSTSEFSLKLVDIKNAGNKELAQIQWFYTPNGGSETQITGTDMVLKIPENTLTAGTTYIFTAKIKNWYKTSDEIEISSETISVVNTAFPLPDSNIVTEFKIYPFKPVELHASVHSDNLVVTDFSFTWAKVSGTFDFVAGEDSPKYVVPEYFFPPEEAEYKIKCTASFVSDSSASVEIIYTINVILPPLTCKISGSGIYFANQGFTLSAEKCTDKGEDGEQTDIAQKLDYQWSCLDTEGNACSDSEGTTIANKEGAEYMFAGGKFSANTKMEFTLKCKRSTDSDFSNAASVTSMVKIMPAEANFLEIKCPIQVNAAPNRKIGLTCDFPEGDLQINWKTEDFDEKEFLTDTNNRFLGISPEAMVPGKKANVEVQVVDSSTNSKGFGIIILNILKPPKKGTLVFSAPNGASNGYDTEVELYANGFEDGEGNSCSLEYEYSFAKAATDLQWKKMRKVKNPGIKSAQFPCGQLYFKVKVIGCSGLSSEVVTDNYLSISGCQAQSSSDLTQVIGKLDKSNADESLGALSTLAEDYISSSDTDSTKAQKKNSIINSLSEIEDEDISNGKQKVTVIKSLFSDTKGTDSTMCNQALGILENYGTQVKNNLQTTTKTTADDLEDLDYSDDSSSLDEDDADDFIDSVDKVAEALKSSNSISNMNKIQQMRDLVIIGGLTKMKDAVPNDESEGVISSDNFKGKLVKTTKKEYKQMTMQTDSTTLSTANSGLGDGTDPVNVLLLDVSPDLFKNIEPADKLSETIPCVNIISEDGESETVDNLQGVSMTMKLDQTKIENVSQVKIMAKGEEDSQFNENGVSVTNYNKETGKVTYTTTHFTYFTAIADEVLSSTTGEGNWISIQRTLFFALLIFLLF